MRSSKRISHSCSWGWVTSSISSTSASAAARASPFIRSATSLAVASSVAMAFLYRFGQEGRHIHDSKLVAALAHSVVGHDSAERAGDRGRFGACLRRLACALLVDLPAPFLHPHVSTTCPAAEASLAAALHLDRLAHRRHDLAGALQYVIVPGQVAGVVIGDRCAVRAGLEAPLAHEL